MVIDLIAGQISLTITGVPPLLPHVQGKRLRGIAVASEARLSLLPDLPTVIESGVPGYEVVQWYGVLAPGGTRSVEQRLNDVIVIARRDDREFKLARRKCAGLNGRGTHAAAKYSEGSAALADVIDDLEPKGRDAMQLFGRRQHPHAMHAQIAQDLRANPVGAQYASAQGRRRLARSAAR